MDVCQFCKGQKIIKGPNSNLYQRCPACNGTGKDESGGIPFTFVYEKLPLGANVKSFQDVVNIQNGDFKLLFLVGLGDGIFTCQLSAGKNQTFSDKEVHRDNLFGTAQNPMPVLAPYTFKKGTLLGVQLSDLSGANNNIRLGFTGVLYL
ncbi:MAG TPA: hypothetical protein VH024_00275 [Candidatus Angelobacter sp.]|jgi:hypothetical protein|nr:hypothetical protein [Candidatus Angelobacter sp.]